MFKPRKTELTQRISEKPYHEEQEKPQRLNDCRYTDYVVAAVFGFDFAPYGPGIDYDALYLLAGCRA